MQPPVLSVIIPTHARAHLLPRAIGSALALPLREVEVIVVPNGPDTSWMDAVAPWADDTRVTVSPLLDANGNVARTHGLKLARGTYVRFLDDDDFLYPSAARQIELLESSGYDVASGKVALIDQTNRHLGLARVPTSGDFVVAAVGLNGFRLPVGNVFRRTALKGSHWDADVRSAQDYAWMIDLAGLREWRWIALDEEVGAWFQHEHQRVSPTTALRTKDRRMVDRLISLHRLLLSTDRQTPERRRAVAEAIWYYVHRGFPFHPGYWRNVARLAHGVDPTARPVAPHFHLPVVRWMSPVAIEWTLLPARRLATALRELRRRFVRDDYRRKI